MDAFGLGPLPHGWECKIEPKTGRIYYINHPGKATTWDDPRLNMIPPPPYHVAVTQPTAYFEDTGGSRWSSPVPSLRGFTLNRRGSSPRLGGSPRIAPSPTLPPKNLRNEQLILEPRVSQAHSSNTNVATSTAQALKQQYLLQSPQSSNPPQKPPPQYQQHEDACIPSSHASPLPGPSSYSTNKITSSHLETNDMIMDRPMSARSYCSSAYSGVPASYLSNCDPDTAFKAVCALFPTARETHISHLFHKYHNRATLVVSALQVEKHPIVNDIATQLHLSEISPKKDGDTDTIASINADSKSIGISSPYKVNSYTTGSPARTGTPISLLKFSNNQSSVGSLHTRWGSPMLSMSPQLQMVKEEGKPANFRSPKMKLKYMKGIFPAADETFLLDVLTSCENNVQKATEKMQRKGFTRTPPSKPARHKWLEVKCLIEKRQRAIDQHNIALALEPQFESPFPTPVMKPARPHLSVQEKHATKARLLQKFRNLPERFVEWALEAAMYEPEKTERLLQEVCPQTPDEFKPFVVAATATTPPKDVSHQHQRRIRFADGLTTSEFESGLPLVDEDSVIDKLAITAGFQTLGDNVDTPDSGYFELDTKSRKKNFISSLFGIKYDKDKTFVPSSQNAKGANSALARGPNPSFVQTSYLPTLGPSSANRGPNPRLRQGAVGSSQGPNPSLAKGSVWGRKGHPTDKQIAMHHVAVEG